MSRTLYGGLMLAIGIFAISFAAVSGSGSLRDKLRSAFIWTAIVTPIAFAIAYAVRLGSYF